MFSRHLGKPQVCARISPLKHATGRPFDNTPAGSTPAAEWRPPGSPVRVCTGGPLRQSGPSLLARAECSPCAATAIPTREAFRPAGPLAPQGIAGHRSCPPKRSPRGSDGHLPCQRRAAPPNRRYTQARAPSRSHPGLVSHKWAVISAEPAGGPDAAKSSPVVPAETAALSPGEWTRAVSAPQQVVLLA